jgi:hypothetical protein
MCVQLYLHHILRKTQKVRLVYSYGTKLFTKNTQYNRVPIPEDTTMADALQILTILYNIGHFYNTFCASRAIIVQANQDDTFRATLLQHFNDTAVRRVAEEMILKYQYEKWHLLNAYLALNNLNLNPQIKNLCKYLLLLCLDPTHPQHTEKTKYCFQIFYEIRGMAYAACDLSNFQLSLSIDLKNKNEIEKLLRELLSKYNNNEATHKMLDSIRKLLSDVGYNTPEYAIRYYNISQSIQKQLKTCNPAKYHALWSDPDSCLNHKYRQRHIHSNNFLKLTFNEQEYPIFQYIFVRIQHMQHIYYGYYIRPNGDYTIIICLKPLRNPKTTLSVANRVLQCVLAGLRGKCEIHDKRYTAIAIFFLYYVLQQHEFEIQPTTHNQCVLCVRGARAKVKHLNDIIRPSTSKNQHHGNKLSDSAHETEAMKNWLEKDNISDTSLLIPASIRIKRINENKRLAEFDGIIIHPIRKILVFIEAKNTKRAQQAQSQLNDALAKFGITANIQRNGRDAYAEWNWDAE